MKKVLTIILSAIFFGLIAGGVMIGVTKVANYYIPTNETSAVIEQTEDKNNSNNQIKQETITIMPSSSQDVVNLVSDVMPSVVAITNMQKFTQNGFSMFGFYSQPQTYEAPASGSGIIVGKTDTEVIIVTNNHVVQDSSSLSVTFLETDTVDAKIKGTDSTKDLAIIAVQNDKIKQDTLNKIKVARIGDSDSVKIGQQVVAIGNALGYGQTVTQGIISAKDRVIEDMSEKLLQTDATINPGNSGGPLFNTQGEVIGINVAKSSGTAVEGMGYAIPIKAGVDVIDKLSARKTREEVPKEEQGYLGIMARNIDSTTAESFDMPEGVYVYKITEGSAAASNLKEKDIIISFDDQNVKTFTDLTDLLSYTKAGESVKIKVKRLDGGAYVEKEISIVLGKRPEEENKEADTKNNNSNANKETTPDNQGGNNGNFIDPFSGFNDDFFNNWFREFRGW
ncbi:MAG: trypsin-like peptidase domain-containing protein [Eubacteriales bacterium]|nr:trypsin-like peptidase domain-containing protein [Eubacteriales bacterium]